MSPAFDFEDFISSVGLKLGMATKGRMTDIEEDTKALKLDNSVRNEIVKNANAIIDVAAVRVAVLKWLIQTQVPWSTGGLTLVDGVLFNSPSPVLQALGGVQVLAAASYDRVVYNAIDLWIVARVARGKGNPPGSVAPDVQRAQTDLRPKYASAANYTLIFDWIEDVGNS